MQQEDTYITLNHTTMSFTLRFKVPLQKALSTMHTCARKGR